MFVRLGEMIKDAREYKEITRAELAEYAFISEEQIEGFDTLLKAKVLVGRWRREYNHIRPHSSLGYRPPAPEAIMPMGV